MKEKKVLIVDFDEESLLSISDLVNEEGFRAVTATDGLAGYEKFKAEDYDLVILEPMLPRLHGFELCKKIIQDPARKIPIIVVTGIYREPSCKMEAIQVYGASAYFTKPWSKEELRAKMLELLAAARETPARVPEPRTEPSPIAASPPQEVPAPRKSPRELKTSQDLDEVEKELRAAVAGIISPVPKKEVREKKEHRKGLDLEVEAILKRTIDELGLEETKKRPAAARHEPAVKPAPPLRPALAPRPDPWKDEPRASVAEEIKKGISARETSTNNIPATSSRAFEAEKEPFGIDRTLLEIDKIPLDLEKPGPEVEKEPVADEVTPEEKKKVFLDDYTEPKKKKTMIFAVAGLSAALVVAASLTFVVFKSKKPGQPSKEMVSSLTPTLPAEFSSRQQEIRSAAPEKKAEPPTATKPEVKKTSPNQRENQPEEIPGIVNPILPGDVPPVQLLVQAEAPPETPPAKEETPPAQAAAARPETEEPAPAKAQPGSLVPLAEVHMPPVLLKRVEPKYPAAALTLGKEGSVTINVLISEEGEVIRTEILKGVKDGYGFERAAENAVKQWVFKPAQKDGVNVKVWKPFEINFKLNQTPSKE